MPSQRETLLCHYHYDALDQLISHTLADTPERQRFYCKSRLATEIQGALQYSIVQHGDQLLAQQQRQGDALDATLLATDQQRSVLHTVNANTPKAIAYSPYGHRTAESGLTSLLGFNGERPDSVTGHYLLGNGYRAFNPVLMRFNSPDNLSPFGEGGVNSYAYCLGDPVNREDTTGHISLILQHISNTVHHIKITTLTSTTLSTPIITMKSPTTTLKTSFRTTTTTTKPTTITIHETTKELTFKILPSDIPPAPAAAFATMQHTSLPPTQSVTPSLATPPPSTISAPLSRTSSASTSDPNYFMVGMAVGSLNRRNLLMLPKPQLRPNIRQSTPLRR
ncbi:RHS repeat-associated core domain-containing protein [Pseudomonas sp. H11T01]|uniref:RHS repeat-associated core domain-containing protein n=1 Tax=Pseudomonas sp. H11T01 TaxID=3402749 RepID=UPI003AD150DD